MPVKSDYLDEEDDYTDQELEELLLERPLTKSNGDVITIVDDDSTESPFINGGCTQWSTSDDKIFIPTTVTVPKLKPGVYEVDRSANVGLYLERVPIKTEGLLRFPDTNSDKVLAEIKKFWEREHIFKEYGLSYKRGILLYGPPGSGKSSTVQLVMQDVVRRGGIVINFDNHALFVNAMRRIREIEPDTPVVVVMEDLDSIINRSNESAILNILDGMNQINKVVFLATTNYPEELGARIVNRPSRFDKRFRIGMPSAESRRMYFEHLIGAENVPELKIDLDKWVADTKDLSIAHLRELFIAVVILDDTYDDALKTLRSMKTVLKDKKGKSGSVGFMINADDEDE